MIGFDRMPAGYYKALTERYRVIVISYPENDPSQAFVDSLTPDRVCQDVLAVADADIKLRIMPIKMQRENQPARRVIRERDTRFAPERLHHWDLSSFQLVQGMVA